MLSVCIQKLIWLVPSMVPKGVQTQRGGWEIELKEKLSRGFLGNGKGACNPHVRHVSSEWMPTPDFRIHAADGRFQEPPQIQSR